MSKGVTFARGFSGAVAAAGVKHGIPERDDVAVIASDRPCSAAGQAIQNANLALGLDETAGLRLTGVLV